uniref:Rho GTPase activating protein 9 n=1 Tax=Neolamprologus brichardi TaxID=32507 RepID=A0A3Q4GPT7_NEOBR
MLRAYCFLFACLPRASDFCLSWQSPGSCLAYPALSRLKSQTSILPAKLAEQDCGKAMLSGSWRRSFGHQQPAAGSVANTRGMTVCGVPSGTVVLEAQYDYSYRGADGRQVCIREGERFILLKKTNADWWQVRRIGAASKAKPLYVPATYVTEVPIVPMPSPQRLTATASLNTNFRILPRVSLSPSATGATKKCVSYTQKPGNSRPESSVDLRGAKLHWANELSSKKNVFKLRTVTGNEFLLQSETDSLIREWYSTIQNVIDRLVRNTHSLTDTHSWTTQPSHLHFHPSSLADNPLVLPRSTSNLENTERKRVKTRLKKLILKRPPLQALQEKGLIKDQVFGCSLEMLCERERSTVPRFVRLCTEAVERRGLETDGIYRVSGNLAVIQKLRFLVNHERAVTTDGRYMFPAELVQEEKLNLDESEWEDIHVITGALKLFFRELPEPLVPYAVPCVAASVPLHPTAVETFHSKPQMSTSCWL